jgi:hypothetical protein
MRKSTKVTLTVVAVVGLSSCARRRPDPCQSANFNAVACQQAIQNGGYYFNGSWVTTSYHYPFPYYYDSYRGYMSSGGSVSSAPDSSYSRPAGAPASGVERGGFGSTGSGSSDGGGGDSAGE